MKINNIFSSCVRLDVLQVWRDILSVIESLCVRVRLKQKQFDEKTIHKTINLRFPLLFIARTQHFLIFNNENTKEKQILLDVDENDTICWIKWQNSLYKHLDCRLEELTEITDYYTQPNLEIT